MTVDASAYFGWRLVDNAECCGPERDALVKVRNVDDEVAYAATLHRRAAFLN